MHPHREQLPLLVQPRFSRRLTGFVVLTHLLAVASTLALPGTAWLTLLIPIGISLLWQVQVHCRRRAPWSIHRATWQADGSWTIVLVSGAERQAHLSPATFISVPLVVLNLRQGRLRRWSLPLFADALDPDALRRLRQRLRVEGAGSGAAPAAA